MKKKRHSFLSYPIVPCIFSITSDERYDFDKWLFLNPSELPCCVICYSTDGNLKSHMTASSTILTAQKKVTESNGGEFVMVRVLEGNTVEGRNPRTCSAAILSACCSNCELSMSKVESLYYAQTNKDDIMNLQNLNNWDFACIHAFRNLFLEFTHHSVCKEEWTSYDRLRHLLLSKILKFLILIGITMNCN